jgi:hypothetical protein
MNLSLNIALTGSQIEFLAFVARNDPFFGPNAKRKFSHHVVHHRALASMGLIEDNPKYGGLSDDKNNYQRLTARGKLIVKLLIMESEHLAKLFALSMERP